MEHLGRDDEQHDGKHPFEQHHGHTVRHARAQWCRPDAGQGDQRQPGQIDEADTARRHSFYAVPVEQIARGARQRDEKAGRRRGADGFGHGDVAPDQKGNDDGAAADGDQRREDANAQPGERQP